MGKRAWSVFKRSVVRLALKEHGDSDLVVRSTDIITRCWDAIAGFEGRINEKTVSAFSAFCTAVGVLNDALGIDIDPLLIIRPKEDCYEDRD